ncbi:alginate export family protein [Neptunicella sp. SCSIO 80796]|uniref:alginate export family protein n=1 Tax=Neptunicella plasticusilytica TaxID=3117012 RepID=UPI003A4E00FC
MQHTKLQQKTITISLASLFCSTFSAAPMAESVNDIFTDTHAKIDMRLRYESVDQDNALKDADALTLRTRFNFITGSYNGFSAVFELEDSRSVLGLDNYNNGNGSKSDYSVIADPETTELDQAFLQYINADFRVKLGRQVIALDGQRFVGHVGWRQDKQTFDAVSAIYQPLKELKLTYAYVTQRNRIFAEQKDIDASDHLLNAAYITPIGTLTGYAYLLEADNGSDNGLDTWGASFAGQSQWNETSVNYRFEYASQDADNGASSFSADYLAAEAGINLAVVDIKLGYESLGSDKGQYGFATPLATLHKFNGWSDQFLSTPTVGLNDVYASIGGKVMGGQWNLIYHDFSADKASSTVDDLGNEINALFSKKLDDHFSAGTKLARYSAGDAPAGKVDTDKIWLWLGASF